MIHTTTTTKLDRENPWPGLESYGEDGKNFFFGRNHQAERLLKKVLDAPVTVLYGRSGLGKTSLLQAGLFPRLRDRNFLPIYVRFDVKTSTASLTSQLHQFVHDAIRGDAPDAVLPSEDEPLWEYLHRADLQLWSARNYLLTPVIVLDQFEELFTLGERVLDRINDFRNDLGDLAENRIPAELAERIKNDETAAERLNLRTRHYKLLISLREDFLPDLEGWCRLIPALGRSRMRLLPLQTDDALDAVHKPAANLMTEALAHRVVDIVAAQADVDRRDPDLGASDVDPAMLSLFCRELNEMRKQRNLAHFDEQLVEDGKDTTLPNYYVNCVRGLRPSVAEFIETKLITEKGFRNFYARDDAVPSRLTTDELSQLISSRLLRVVDHYGAPRIELTHDVLTRPVLKHREQRRAEEEKEKENAALAAAAERERQAAKQREAELDLERRAERERHLESESAQARRLRKLTVALAMVSVVAVVLALTALYFERKAAAERNDALVGSVYADSQLMLAGLSPHGSNDIELMLKLLAAHAISPRNYELLTTLNAERDVLKVIDVPDVTTVAFSPDGTRIATGSADNTMRLWNTDGQPIGQMPHDDDVTSVAFSPDGTRIASADIDGTVRVWDAHTQQQVEDVEPYHIGAVNTVAFSPDGTRIATASQDTTIRLWDAATGSPIGTLHGHEAAVTAFAFGPDGRHVVSSGDDGTVRLFDSSWQPMLGHSHGAWANFFDDGRRIGSGSLDKTVRWWDAATGRPIGAPLRVDDPDVVALFPVDENRLLSRGLVDTARLWDARTGEPLGDPLRIPFNPDWVVTADDTANPRIAAQLGPNVVQVYQSDPMRPLGVPIQTVDNVSTIVFSRDGRLLATGGVSGTVELWETDTGAPRGQPMKGEGPPVSSIAFSSDGQRLAAGYEDYTLWLWDTLTFKPVGNRNRMRLDSNPLALAFSLDGSTLASGGVSGTIQLWDIGDQSKLGAPLTGHWDSVMSLYFSSDGKRLLSAGLDGELRVWPILPSSPNLLCAKLTHDITPDQWNAWISPDIKYRTVCPDLP